jgi:ACS family allantoate permease-like MFS transporter
MTDEKSNTSSDVEKEPVRRWESGGAPPSFINHAIDPDDAMKAFEGHEGEVLVLDAATNKRLLRKIDLHLMPVCTIFYITV